MKRGRPKAPACSAIWAGRTVYGHVGTAPRNKGIWLAGLARRGYAAGASHSIDTGLSTQEPVPVMGCGRAQGA